MSFSSPYQPAAKLLNELLFLDDNKNHNRNNHKSLKSLVYDNSTGNLVCSKSTYAQVCNVLSNQRLLKQLLDETDFMDNTNVRNKGLLYVLLYELLLGPHQSIKGGGTIKRKLLKVEPKLRASLERIQNEEGDSNTTASSGNYRTFPRYVRVNTLKTSMEEVVEILIAKHNIPRNQIYRDRHAPNLLVLPPNSTKQLVVTAAGGGDDKNNDDDSSSSGLDLIASGKIILQDKSSCFPALCLVHGFESDESDDDDNDQDDDDHPTTPKHDYIDACAAPGNKTTHLAALVSEVSRSSTKSTRSTTTIYAFDRSNDRLKLLKKRVREFVPSSAAVKIKSQLQDFLATRPSDYPTVGSILLDPSCSGSGIYSSIDQHGNQDKDDDSSRIKSLSSFQYKALCHAMSFNSVDRIVYSTCSVHQEENEDVVARALMESSSDSNWEIVAPICLSEWERRGITPSKASDNNGGLSLTDEQASCMIRVNQDDATNGFFVCCLLRKKKKSRKPEPQPKNQKKTTSNDDNISSSIPLYDGQFAATSEAEKNQNTVTGASSGSGSSGDTNASSTEDAPTKKNKKRKETTVANTSNNEGRNNTSNKDEKKKRKKNEQSSAAAAAAAAAVHDNPTTTTTSKDQGDNTVISKKKRKKMEWKRKQKQAMIERRMAQRQQQQKKKKEESNTTEN